MRYYDKARTFDTRNIVIMLSTKEKQGGGRPTAAELAVLQLLWQHGPLTVKAVHEKLNEANPVVYTTILKTMQVMLERDFVSREPHGRAHLYTAAIEEEATKSRLIDVFVERAFGGSAMKMVMKALGNNRTSQAELDQLKAFINDLEDEQNEAS